MSLFAHADGSVTNYLYNADGIRTGKQYLDAGGGELGTVKYTLDGNKIVAEQRGNTMLYYLYDDNGSVMGIGYGDNTYTFAKNIQGDVIGIYSGGTLVAKYEYNAYGEITAITNASGTDISNNATHIANLNPFRYRGYYYDTETGFYYLQSRYYDPVVGRFLNADAILGANGGIIGYNLFAYCNNNPVCYVDVYGTACEYAPKLYPWGTPMGVEGIPIDHSIYTQKRCLNTKKQTPKFSNCTIKAGPSRPNEIMEAIQKANIPSYRRSGVIPPEKLIAISTSSCGRYVIYSFLNSDNSKVSDYYFSLITQSELNAKKKNLARMPIIINVVDFFSSASDVVGAPDYMAFFGNVMGIISNVLVSKMNSMNDEIIYYGQGGKYELHKVVTFLYCGGEKVLGTTYYP